MALGSVGEERMVHAVRVVKGGFGVDGMADRIMGRLYNW